MNLLALMQAFNVDKYSQQPASEAMLFELTFIAIQCCRPVLTAQGTTALQLLPAESVQKGTVNPCQHCL